LTLGWIDDLIRARLSNTYDPRRPENARSHRVASRTDSGDRDKEFLITSRLFEAFRFGPRSQSSAE
jgi:hypothetical protein